MSFLFHLPNVRLRLRQIMSFSSESFCMRTGASKPPLPYHDGLELLLRPHKPSELPDEPDATLRRQGRTERHELHPLVRCLLHPPAPGKISDSEMFIILRIIAPLRAGDGHAAQLLVVEAMGQHDTSTPDGPLAEEMPGMADEANATGLSVRSCAAWPLLFVPPPGERIVAKIYDPLYYDHEQDDVDPFVASDLAYAAETAAYETLTRLHGSVVPRYYGSYMFELFEPSMAATRAVRLILLEYIGGQAMRDLDPRDFSQRDRQDIIRGIIDAESALYAEGVFQRDLMPRNVMLLIGPNAATASSLPLTQPTGQQLAPDKTLNTDNATRALGGRDQAAWFGKPRAAPATLLPERCTSTTASAQAASERNGRCGVCSCRTLSVVLIDFGNVSVNRNVSEGSPCASLFQFSGKVVTPLLRWHRAWWGRVQWGFETWIDWEWQPWLEDCYGHTRVDITDDMRAYWLPQYLLDPISELHFDNEGS